MANKKSLLGGATIKVENMSGFDKSGFHALTAPLGAIVPIRKQLLLPGKGKLSIKISAQLPPLATDAFLRTHLKVEAFLVPMRLCYGGFQSWFAGEQISYKPGADLLLSTAKLPYFRFKNQGADITDLSVQAVYDKVFGVHSLMDYFGVKEPIDNGHVKISLMHEDENFNIFPFIAYQLCYHHWYRNKLVQLPLFAPTTSSQLAPSQKKASALPYLPNTSREAYGFNLYDDGALHIDNCCGLLNGDLVTLRQRNYGYDYFTTGLPSAQDGQPMSVDTSSGSFTISALRLSNSLQHFAEVNQLAGPDYIQTCRARFGKAPSDGVAQRPILLGSADFPMFTSGVEQTAQDVPASPNGNPFAGIGARYGRAHAEGSDFVCDFDCDEPSYLMVMASLVPEANYATGIAHDMTIFTQEGSIVDLPCAELERAGLEPIFTKELAANSQAQQDVFAYQPRYMWHKAGQLNEVSGLFRQGASLESFIPQRDFTLATPTLSSDFLQVDPTDLDNVTAVSGAISEFGVMIDSAIELYVSEPLGESVLPSLVDPASEHGNSVYLQRGGISLKS